MKRKALFIGVNEYEDAQIRDLNYSLSDAHALKTLFELFGYETDILENPAKSDVFSAVKKMTCDLSAGDLFFFYFAGHGWTTTSGKHLLFCKDDMYEDLRDEDAGISFNKLKRKTTGVYNRAFVLDACRSDFITGTRGDDTTTRDLRPIGELVKDAPTTSSLAVLRSCSKYEHALEIESRKHGLFTLAMMDVLRASKESGTELLFGESLCDAVTQKMAVIARAEGIVAAQTPEFAKSGIAQVLVSGRRVPPHQYQQSAATPTLVVCPTCFGNVRIEGTHNCMKCGKKYVCADCWDREYRCCAECAAVQRRAHEEAERKADVNIWAVPEGGHKKIQLWKDGPYWAETNIGAEKPWESGYYFWWGDTVGYKFENGIWVASDGSETWFSFEEENASTYGKTIKTLERKGITAGGILEPEYDAAYVQWGEEWYMPTDQELGELCYMCDWIWTTMNGVGGYVVRGKGEYASASIFLPCAGGGYGPSLDEAGPYGGYWSSVQGSDRNASCLLCFSSSYHTTIYEDRYCGQSVRPVQWFTK